MFIAEYRYLLVPGLHVNFLAAVLFVLTHVQFYHDKSRPCSQFRHFASFGTDFRVLSKDIDIFFYTCQVLNFEHGLIIL